jgi:hypothetical protein
MRIVAAEWVIATVDFVKSRWFREIPRQPKSVLQTLVCGESCADFQIEDEVVMLIVALFAAFLFGIVVGSGLEVIVRDSRP